MDNQTELYAPENWQPPKKQANFDITCLLDGREPANVEIQTYATDTLFKKRVEYHIAHLLNHFVEKGKKWYDVPKSYQISIVDFIFNSETKNCVSRYEMQTEEKHKLESRMNIIIVELPKIKKMGNIAPEKLTNLEKWGKFFVEADDPKNQEYMQDIACKEKGIMEAQEVLSGLNISYSMWTAQEHHDNVVRERIMMKREQRQMKRETDMMRRETAAMKRETAAIKRENDTMKRENEKLKHELETQHEKSLQQGAHEKAIETARSMLTLGVNTMEQISQVTGLTLAEIEQLQKQAANV